jgi:hypothetical protein
MGGGRYALLLRETDSISLFLGDRVQWFRAEADMERWQEQVEIKLAEFLRHACSCKRMKTVWSQLSESQSENLPGYVAYAKQKAAMFARMERECEDSFDKAGYKDLRLRIAKGEQSLVQYVMVKRAEALAWLQAGDIETSKSLSYRFKVVLPLNALHDLRPQEKINQCVV